MGLEEGGGKPDHSEGEGITHVIVEKKKSYTLMNMVFVLAKGASVNKIRKKNNGG